MSNNLSFNQNNDGSYTIEWDRNDPDWKWMNNLTSKEIEGIIFFLLPISYRLATYQLFDSFVV